MAKENPTKIELLVNAMMAQGRSDFTNDIKDKNEQLSMASSSFRKYLRESGNSFHDVHEEISNKPLSSDEKKEMKQEIDSNKDEIKAELESRLGKINGELAGMIEKGEPTNDAIDDKKSRGYQISGIFRAAMQIYPKAEDMPVEFAYELYKAGKFTGSAQWEGVQEYIKGFDYRGLFDQIANEQNEYVKNAIAVRLEGSIGGVQYNAGFRLNVEERTKIKENSTSKTPEQLTNYDKSLLKLYLKELIFGRGVDNDKKILQTLIKQFGGTIHVSSDKRTFYITEADSFTAGKMSVESYFNSKFKYNTPDHNSRFGLLGDVVRLENYAKAENNREVQLSNIDEVTIPGQRAQLFRYVLNKTAPQTDEIVQYLSKSPQKDQDSFIEELVVYAMNQNWDKEQVKDYFSKVLDTFTNEQDKISMLELIASNFGPDNLSKELHAKFHDIGRNFVLYYAKEKLSIDQFNALFKRLDKSFHYTSDYQPKFIKQSIDSLSINTPKEQFDATLKDIRAYMKFIENNPKELNKLIDGKTLMARLAEKSEELSKEVSKLKAENKKSGSDKTAAFREAKSNLDDLNLLGKELSEIPGVKKGLKISPYKMLAGAEKAEIKQSKKYQDKKMNYNNSKWISNDDPSKYPNKKILDEIIKEVPGLKKQLKSMKSVSTIGTMAKSALSTIKSKLPNIKLPGKGKKR